MEDTTTIRIYLKDLKALRSFMDRKKISSIRDAIRICLEYTNAHGGLT